MSDLETLTQDLRRAVRAAAPLIEAVGPNARALAQQLGHDNEPVVDYLAGRAVEVQQEQGVAQAEILRGAMQGADGGGGRFRRAGGEVDRFRQDLEQAGKHLREGVKSRAKLIDVLGAETPEIKKLGDRLTDLSGAVKAAGEALGGADQEIRGALRSVSTLMESRLGGDGAEAAGKIRAAQIGLREGADGLKVTLGAAAAKLAEKEPDRLAALDETDALAKAGEDGSLAKAAGLAKTADAARNPTPKDQQVAPGSASRAGDRAHNPASPTQERGL